MSAPDPSPGARLRTDIVDVYLFRAEGGAVSFLQLRRATAPRRGEWHPVMGHTRPGESAVDCALREVGEEVGLDARSGDCLGLWQLEQVHPYFIAALDAIVLSPRFALRVRPAWAPALNHEHDACRWSALDAVDDDFRWPGQRACCREIASEIVARGAQPTIRV